MFDETRLTATTSRKFCQANGASQTSTSVIRGSTTGSATRRRLGRRPQTHCLGLTSSTWRFATLAAVGQLTQRTNLELVPTRTFALSAAQLCLIGGCPCPAQEPLCRTGVRINVYESDCSKLSLLQMTHTIAYSHRYGSPFQRGFLDLETAFVQGLSAPTLLVDWY